MRRANPSTAGFGHQYSDEEVRFMLACDDEKRRLGKVSLEWAEVLAIAVRLGYRLVAEPMRLPQWEGPPKGFRYRLRG